MKLVFDWVHSNLGLYIFMFDFTIIASISIAGHASSWPYPYKSLALWLIPLTVCTLQRKSVCNHTRSHKVLTTYIKLTNTKRDRFCYIDRCSMVQSKRTKTWHIVLYIKQMGMEKRQTHVMGSVTPGAVGNTPTCAQKKTHIHQNVFMHHFSHHERSAGRPWCWHSSRFFCFF